MNLTKPIFWEYNILEEDSGYYLSLWIPEDQIDNLIEFSQDAKDKALLNNTWDLKRFSSLEKFESWYNDEWRHLFCLLDSEKKLAWIWWGRPSKFPNINKVINSELHDEISKNKNNIHTNWVRIYPKYRWKWLAKIIFKSEVYYRKIFPEAYMSVDINSDNIASQKWFEKLGYKCIAYWKNINNWNIEDNNRMIYVRWPNI